MKNNKQRNNFTKNVAKFTVIVSSMAILTTNFTVKGANSTSILRRVGSAFSGFWTSIITEGDKLKLELPRFPCLKNNRGSLNTGNSNIPEIPLQEISTVDGGIPNTRGTSGVVLTADMLGPAFGIYPNSMTEHQILRLRRTDSGRKKLEAAFRLNR